MSSFNYTPDPLPAGATADMTISGTGFVSGASVSFENGSGPAPSASVSSVTDDGTTTTISGTVTAGSGGPARDRIWDVPVTNPDGSSVVVPGALTVTP